LGEVHPAFEGHHHHHRVRSVLCTLGVTLITSAGKYAVSMLASYTV
jgi:hypothetical protein